MWLPCHLLLLSIPCMSAIYLCSFEEVFIFKYHQHWIQCARILNQHLEANNKHNSSASLKSMEFLLMSLKWQPRFNIELLRLLNSPPQYDVLSMDCCPQQFIPVILIMGGRSCNLKHLEGSNAGTALNCTCQYQRGNANT